MTVTPHVGSALGSTTAQCDNEWSVQVTPTHHISHPHFHDILEVLPRVVVLHNVLTKPYATVNDTWADALTPLVKTREYLPGQAVESPASLCRVTLSALTSNTAVAVSPALACTRAKSKSCFWIRTAGSWLGITPSSAVKYARITSSPLTTPVLCTVIVTFLAAPPETDTLAASAVTSNVV
mmetsp:Transcript_28826/g.86540  ORF Transcript_28826/g.86540 Transcript_28826/m.86540 type:complete len:181 (+) Transcript_28826:47-589(+)